MQLLDIGLNRTFNAVVIASNPIRPTNYTFLNQPVRLFWSTGFFMPERFLSTLLNFNLSSG
jgi:hypothetical protein